jgi:hypothetical protein
VPARRNLVEAFLAVALLTDDVRGEDRPALPRTEAVAAEMPALGDQHAFAAAIRNLDVRLEVTGGVENEGRVAVRRAGHPRYIDLNDNVLRTS